MATNKIDLFKIHKNEYITPQTPKLVETKPAQYLTISGQGEPTSLKRLANGSGS